MLREGLLGGEDRERTRGTDINRSCKCMRSSVQWTGRLIHLHLCNTFEYEPLPCNSLATSRLPHVLC